MNLYNNLSSNKNKANVFIILLCICLFLIFSSFFSLYKIIPINDVFATTIGHGVNSFKDNLSKLLAKFDQNESLVSENIDLRKKIFINDSNLAKLNDLQKELDSLRSLNKVLSIRPNVISAISISTVFSEKLPSTLTIDKGSKDGISNNKVVINDTGSLIGFTYDVASYTSNIKSYYNSENSKKISIKSSTIPTAVIIGAKDGKVIAENVGQNSILLGDSFFTSSIQDLTPEGIYIGKVSGINPENNKQFFLDTDILNTSIVFIYQ